LDQICWYSFFHLDNSFILIFIGNTIFVNFDNCWIISIIFYIIILVYESYSIGRAIFGSGEGPLEVLMALVLLRWFVENDPLWPTLEFAFGVTAASSNNNNNNKQFIILHHFKIENVLKGL
jgi:hypothetical protein